MIKIFLSKNTLAHIAYFFGLKRFTHTQRTLMKQRDGSPNYPFIVML